MSKPRLLDLFCGSGGAAMGYHWAGFDVVGVDIEPQPNYPFEFVQGDAMAVLASDVWMEWDIFSAIHASPPCQAYASISHHARSRHPDLYDATMRLLSKSGLPYAVENVLGAPYRSGVILCGSMFGMKIRRHRNFETSFLVFQPPCDHKAMGRPFTITGAKKHGRAYESAHSKKPDISEFPLYMEMPWSDPYGAAQGVPPAYTKFIGEQLMAVL